MQNNLSNSVKVIYPPSKKIVLDWVQDLVNRLIKSFKIRLISIFGSYAKNTYSFGSDVDLLVVYAESSPLSFEEVLTLALNISNDVNWEIHIYSSAQFEEGLKKGNNFLKGILNEGIKIYSSDLNT